jgi:aminopeptidase N
VHTGTTGVRQVTRFFIKERISTFDYRQPMNIPRQARQVLNQSHRALASCLLRLVSCFSPLVSCLLLLASSSLISPPLANAQAVTYSTSRNYSEPSMTPSEHPLDILRMRLEVSFVPEKGVVRGRVTHIFTPLQERVDSIFFDGPDITIRKATLNGQPIRYQVSSGGVTVFPTLPLQWNRTDSISFTYEATPRRGIYFIGWNDTTGRRHKQIWTQGQGIDNRNWIPCYDRQNDKMITETIVRFDSSYQVLSNGELLSRTNNHDGTATWHYCMTRPHSTYLLMLGIGKYGIETRQTKAGVPVHLYYYPESPERVQPTYQYATECIDFVAEQTGIPYPWSSYSNLPVEDFLYGAMENTTATVYGDFLLVDRKGFHDRNYIDVDVHELAHQWFGDFITGRSPNMAWLHESFATLYPKLFRKQISGEEYYEWMRRQEQQDALKASEQNRLPLVHSQAGSTRVYEKGSAILDMMIYVWGENQFRRVINHYLKHHAYGLVETNDLYQAFQDTLGLSPSWFFDEWIYHGGEPHYEVSYKDVAVHPGSAWQTEISIRQIHPVDELVGYFTMPIVFEVHYTDGTADRVRQTVSGPADTVVVPNPGKRTIAFVLFDPGSMILKKVTFEKPFEELKNQALHAPLIIDRYDAIAAMERIDMPRKRAFLAQAYEREKFFAIREEVVRQCADDSDRVCDKVIRKALRDSVASVRSSVLSSVSTIPFRLRPDFELLLRDSSYAIQAAALSRLAARFPERVGSYLAETSMDEGIGNQVRVIWHELKAGQGDRGSLKSLGEMCGPTYEFKTRVNAFEAVKRLNDLDTTVAANLLDAMVSSNGRLRGPATAAVQYFMQQTVYRNLLQQVYNSTTWQPWQHDLLAPVFLSR